MLECSFKPFASFDRAGAEETARTLFAQWRPLLATADEASVLLWIADGSEILDWRGDLTDSVNWAKWVGFNNTESDPYGHNVRHDMRATQYRPDAPDLDYTGIRTVVDAVKRVGEAELGIPVTVGATFDAGPEFAVSDFKYTRHTEILAKGDETGIGTVIQMVRPWSRLAGDDRDYAGFPDGIPDGTGFGTFLGRQSQDYLTAMGFDYLWLSNGFGFSSFSWTALGETFDGERFHGDRAEKLRHDIVGFWEDLSAELDFPVEVRGTNFTAGQDIGSDCVPALWIYESGIIRKPPPNSPWGPLNRDFGIELTGYMSRIAVLPGTGFPFRFYANDPWFWQNPWWDFYNREPFDIYLPVSVSRVDGAGAIGIATDIEILGVDTARGVLDPRAGAEIGGQINRAREAAPDAAGPFVWLYPFREYHEAMAAEPNGIGDAYFEDWFVTGALNAGLPLNTVVSTDDADGALAAGSLDGRVVLTPASSLDGRVAATVEGMLQRGIDVVVYGAVPEGSAAEELIGVRVDAADPGLAEQLTVVDADGTAVEPGLKHVAAFSSGPIRERLAAAGHPDLRVVASVTDGADPRPYVVERRHAGGGRLVWVRGSSTFDSAPYNEHALRTPVHFRGGDRLDPAEVLVSAVGRLGYTFAFDKAERASESAVQTIHRADNALWFDGYLADTTVGVRYRLPDGAPLLTHSECRLESGSAVYHFGTSFHKECRFIVDQASDGIIRCRELAPFPYGTARLLEARNLVDARVSVLLPPDAEAVRVLVNGEPIEPDDRGDGTIVVSGVTGSVTVGWAIAR